MVGLFSSLQVAKKFKYLMVLKEHAEAECQYAQKYMVHVKNVSDFDIF